MNWKWYARKQLWHNTKHFHGIFLEKQRLIEISVRITGFWAKSLAQGFQNTHPTVLPETFKWCGKLALLLIELESLRLFMVDDDKKSWRKRWIILSFLDLLAQCNSSLKMEVKWIQDMDKLCLQPVSCWVHACHILHPYRWSQVPLKRQFTFKLLPKFKLHRTQL
jgi:hypothetical protein